MKKFLKVALKKDKAIIGKISKEIKINEGEIDIEEWMMRINAIARSNQSLWRSSSNNLRIRSKLKFKNRMKKSNKKTLFLI